MNRMLPRGRPAENAKNPQREEKGFISFSSRSLRLCGSIAFELGECDA